MWQIIFLIFLILSACLIAVIIIRKIPQLILIETNILTKPREEMVKEQIIVSRLKRFFKKIFGCLDFFKKIFIYCKKYFSRLFENLKKREKKYRIHNRAEAEQLLNEAKELMKNNLEQAEMNVLQVIDFDAKNVEAYELLKEIYSTKKLWEEAKEILYFLAKLNPTKKVDYLEEIGEIELKNNNVTEALRLAYQIVVKLGSRAPRHLDFFIEMAILNRNRPLAQKGLEILKEVNPENEKINDLAKRIEELEM